MQTIKTSKKGVDYLVREIKSKKTVSTQAMLKAVLQKIPHTADSEQENICLKIGRYLTGMFGREVVESKNPKSELTLDEEEFRNLVQFISENYKPLKDGVKRYISIDDDFDDELAKKLKSIFSHHDKDRIIQFLGDNDIVNEQVYRGIELQKRIAAIEEFKNKLQHNFVEYAWQEWFTDNDWVLGSDYVRVLEERSLDTSNIVDYFMEAYDGFLDVIEIKRPEGELKFWRNDEDHNNVVPHANLISAITQATNYIYELEREMNSEKFQERIGHIPVVKPRAVLIFGRSNEWNDKQKKAYRLLNASYSNLTILTYDHVLLRAQRILSTPSDLTSSVLPSGSDYKSDVRPEDLPF